MEFFTSPLFAPFLTAALAGAQQMLISMKTVRSLFLAAILLQALPSAAADALKAVTVAQGLVNPWSLAFLPDGRFLVTEKPGRLRIVEADGKLGAPLGGLPAISVGGQCGLLDVVLDPKFADNSVIYFSYAEPASGGESGNSTAVARAKLSGAHADRRAHDLPPGTQVLEQLALRRPPGVRARRQAVRHAGRPLCAQG